MNKGTPKNKKKRAHSSQEANNSFVKNVTSTVSSLLPSSITKWFSSPGTSNANGSAQVTDATDSSSEDDVPESSVSAQPPPKRMRYNPTEKINHFEESEVNSAVTVSNVDSIESFNTIQFPSGRNAFRRKPNSVSTPIITSADEAREENTEQNSIMLKSQHSISSTRHPVTRNRKSLYDTPQKDTLKQDIGQTSSSMVRDPYFKPMLLGSPFYPGRTMYGGAASSYMNQPNIKLCKTATVNETTSPQDNSISHAARRVMDLLENYSSPLSEAKRMSQFINSAKNNSFNRSVDSNSAGNKSNSYKTRELHVPSIASILSLKQKSRLMDTTTTARQIIASHSSSLNYLPYPKSSTQRDSPKQNCTDNLTTKVKNTITRQKRGEANALDNDISTPVKLPTAVLEIDQNNLPKFNFGNPVELKQSTNSSEKVVTPVTHTSTKDIMTTGASAPTENFKFSNPGTISKESSISPPSNKFSYEGPRQNIDEIKVSEDKSECISTCLPQENDKAGAHEPKNWKCSECWVVNKTSATSCVCCSSKKITEDNTALIECHICKCKIKPGIKNICFSCEKTQINDDTELQMTSTSDSSKWKCEDCWVNNNNTAIKCICCGGKNPKAKTLAKNKIVANDTDWKCADCWINNKSNVDKCIACGGARPGSIITGNHTISVTPSSRLISTSFQQPSNLLQNVVKAQSNKWECSNCLVRNDNDKTKCVCCETNKPGIIKETNAKSFNFGMNVNTTFKFGIHSKTQEDNSVKENKSQQKPEKANQPDQCETNNNTIAKIPTFTFGLSVRKGEESEQSINKDSDKVAEVPKINFHFGIPNQTVPVQPTDKKKSPEKSETTEKSVENFQEVPTVEFTLPKTQDVTKTPDNMFAPSMASQISFDNSVNSGSSVVTTSAVTEETNVTFTPLILQTTATSEINKPNTFNFTGSGIKLATNLFSVPVTSVTNTTTSNTLQSVPQITSDSLFQKSDTNTTSSLPPFPKNDSIPSLNLFQKTGTSTSVEAVPSSTKLFSFGNNNQTVLSEPEKPKFTFNFGSSNKTDAPSIFNSNFGSTNSNADTNTNKFTLTTANAVGMDSNLSRSTLGSGNGLNTGNSINSNNLPGNNVLSTGNQSVSDLGNKTLNIGSTVKPSLTIPTTPSSGMFSTTTTQKDNMWPNTNNSSGNLFISNSTNSNYSANNNSAQRPAAFGFGTSTPFNASSASTAFGNNTQNVFGITNQTSTMPSIFSNAPQSQPTPIFGPAQATSNPTPTMSVFVNTNVGATNSFNVQNPSMPTFESHPTYNNANQPQTTNNPTFTFGSQQPGSSVFGFGQQPQTSMPQQFPSSVYSFGANQGTPQFNIGSAPNTSVRRVRKAVRRTTQR